MKLRDIRRRAQTPYIAFGGGLVLLRDYKGKRCRTYDQGCPLCDQWRFYDEHGRFVYGWDELSRYMDTLEDGETPYFRKVVI